MSYLLYLFCFAIAACAADAEIDENATQPKATISAILFDAGFIESVKNLISLLNPVAELTNFCQKSTSSAADAAEKWLQLCETDSSELRTFTEKRMKKSKVLNTVTMTANYFHPIYRGQKLNEEQKQNVERYIFDQLDADGLESCRKFDKNEDLFASLNKKNLVSPNTYWHYASELGHKELAQFAMKFLKIPASTAQLERLFSNWSYIHNDIRNRLSNETSKKLTNIYFTLRSADKIADEDSDIEIDEEN